MSNSQYLIIHKFPVLFNILYEIKSNLNFKVKSVNDSTFSTYLSKDNILIISGDKNFRSEGQVKIKDFPLNIQKLVEIINIQFLKNRYYHQNDIKVGKYIINLNSRMMIFNNKSVSITEKETKIINFLNNSKKPVSINDLQTEVWGHKSKLETHTVETHVYRLRKKVEKKFYDKNFILSLNNGYKIQN